MKTTSFKAGLTLKTLVPALLFLSFFSCSSKNIVIWTDNAEVVSIAELFNASEGKTKAVVVYKENLPSSLPPANDEEKPDILIGTLLKNSNLKKNFAPLSPVLGRSKVNPANIYSPLLEYGKARSGQYLLPVSFNVPVMLFNEEEAGRIKEGSLLEFAEAGETASGFNEKNNHGIFTKMGFAPSWNVEFLYEYVKSHGAAVKEKKNAVSWKNENLETAVTALKDWTLQKNESTATEQDFAFKYIYMPLQKQIKSNKSLFTYTTSGEFFSLSQEESAGIDFKWLSNESKVYVEDDAVMTGIYKKSHNKNNAYAFITWLLDEKNQKFILERNEKMNLGTKTFGICGGFSSIKSVNERVFPVFYKNLLGNVPEESTIVSPEPLPPRWKSLKERVVIPYLLEAADTQAAVPAKTMEDYLSSWRKQFN